ncbi:transposase [Streptomyces sp. ISL-100]|nr:transposase [Streptomyces sp. ISL-100]
MLPDRTPKRGGRWRDHREVIDAIAWKFRTGAQWVQLPEKYGNGRGVYNRLRMWSADRHLGAGIHRASGTGGRRRGPELGHLGGLHDRASPPARGRSPKKSGSGRRAGRPRHRPIPRWADHEDPCRGRRQLPVPGLPPHRRTGR